MKKIIIKILFIVLSIVFLFCAAWKLYYTIKYGIENIKFWESLYGHEEEIIINNAIKDNQINILHSAIFFLTSLLFFLVINIKGLQFVTVSTIQLIKEHKAKTSAERFEKKQAKLAREIAEKQAELEKMNNSTKEE